ncbi:MAG: YdiU family protein [Cyclobacteriaceae bacterium]|nr:YdiU family protein [Cyclobacteriaceae bacterium]
MIADRITAQGNPWNFDNSYLQLPEKMYSKLNPVPVKAPSLILFNHTLAEEIGLDVKGYDWQKLAACFSGNEIPGGADPLAQAYAGHQFGHFTMLGDGRAILLGEHLTPDGKRIDIQLKGSGRTPYSRRGDGRATLYSMLREYLISEAMHYLGIPSSRSLAVVSTGEPVYRERIHKGAILTRLAGSHIRVGTFEYTRNFLGDEELEKLVDYSLERHYPDDLQKKNKALALLDVLVHRQARLISEWMRVGFIHGVMNTDNMGIAAETFDYGPCAFMNAYNPATVFSSIDTEGRYAYGNQPYIAHWNLGSLAGALLPLIHPEQEKAIEMAKEVLNEFPAIYQQYWKEMMRNKLGLTREMEGDLNMMEDLLVWMHKNKADYTLTFYRLSHDKLQEDPAYLEEGFIHWLTQWKERINAEDGTLDDARAIMKKANPVHIPRNHKVEEVLLKAADHQQFEPLETMLELVKSPYEERPEYEPFKYGPEQGDGNYRTFCGT